MEKGHIFFIMWVSWAWKGTLIENLKKQNEIDLFFTKSYVTRPMREWEINGNIYNFISKEEFELSIENWEFLEYFKVYWLPYYYWTKYEDVISNWINKWKIVIKEIDMNWLLILKSNNPELKKYYSSIFLNLPLDEQLKRIKSRWVHMLEEEFIEREKTALEEEKKSKKYCDYIVDANKDQEQILKQILEIIINK